MILVLTLLALVFHFEEPINNFKNYAFERTQIIQDNKDMCELYVAVMEYVCDDVEYQYPVQFIHGCMDVRCSHIEFGVEYDMDGYTSVKDIYENAAYLAEVHDAELEVQEDGSFTIYKYEE